jgi:hypothetical protein
MSSRWTKPLHIPHNICSYGNEEADEAYSTGFMDVLGGVGRDSSLGRPLLRYATLTGGGEEQVDYDDDTLFRVSPFDTYSSPAQPPQQPVSTDLEPHTRREPGADFAPDTDTDTNRGEIEAELATTTTRRYTRAEKQKNQEAASLAPHDRSTRLAEQQQHDEAERRRYYEAHYPRSLETWHAPGDREWNKEQESGTMRRRRVTRSLDW